ncbi:hypothetical protein HC031_09070 [Planosporangium thailandense]|uniref:Uncharacterized protein n=1 Tax=Planosporangium thailandense TaxID=765197 RepID=A0ABX0XV15_9ACTN|nr:hypothetical protein [Planosporangium thailandense]NJC69868.1 hypothetical protein [Planosporangium thailandense]
MTAENLDTDELIALLHLGTDELFYIEAAVRLVERHRYWLEQPTFRRFIELFDNPYPRSAGIWWKDAVAALDRGELECDQEAANVLRIAASIATFYQVSFRDVMESLSPETMKHAAEALMCAGGYTESVATPKF